MLSREGLMAFEWCQFLFSDDPLIMQVEAPPELNSLLEMRSERVVQATPGTLPSLPPLYEVGSKSVEKAWTHFAPEGP
jgi:hypothetical protein